VIGIRSMFALVLIFAAAASESRGELKSLEVFERTPFAEGKSFGTVGPYDRIVGIARFELDPADPHNRAIVDLQLAPRNAAGKVEFESDVFILAPHDIKKGNGAILYDVNNRGRKLALRFFNHAEQKNDPRTEADAGDGFLMRQGFVIVWSGWLGELHPGDSRLLMRAPQALEDGKPVRGPVRYEMMTDEPTETMPLSRREGHGSFPLTERGLKEATLTHRERVDDKRIAIPREQWSLATQPIPPAPEVAPGKRSIAGSLPQIRLKVAGGFKPGHLYELIAECEGSVVQGVCYPAVRDLVSFLRYDDSPRNPLRTAEGTLPINRAHAFGVSQSGRYLRNFVYLNFNADERDRIVFSGMIAHVAGAGLGWFNHRFCQPTRLNSQHLEHTYPSDYFPFTYGDDVDPHTGRTDGILRRTRAQSPHTLPMIMHTQGTGEYWHRGGSLVHTDPLGTRDAVVPDNVRIYTFGGTQHSATSYPLARGTGDNLLNPADYSPFLLALLERLDRWTLTGAEPPESVYPRIADGMLVDWSQKSTGFPKIPGVRYPSVIHQPEQLDFGPEFESKGIVTIEPPRRGAKYVVKVPRVGPDGNELGTLLPIEVAKPTATYTGWNLRRADVGADGQLVSLMGSYIAFPITKKERIASGDPRVSIEERYGSFEDYRLGARFVAHQYNQAGYVTRDLSEGGFGRFGGGLGGGLGGADAFGGALRGVDGARKLFPLDPRPEERRGELPTITMRFTPTRMIPAAEAHQAAAADAKYVYAIGNRTVAKYDRTTGKRIAVSPPSPLATHLNSGFFHEGWLYCAHSNYPAQPPQSEILVLNPMAMELKVFKRFGAARGSLTWAVFHEGHWWCTFAHYGADNAKTVLVKFDEQWNERGVWTYPPAVIADLGKASISGGLWRGETLLATGHDRQVIYRLKLPAEGTVLELVDVAASPFPGQGIAVDPVGGLIGIDRAAKEIVFAE